MAGHGSPKMAIRTMLWLPQPWSFHFKRTTPAVKLMLLSSLLQIKPMGRSLLRETFSLGFSNVVKPLRLGFVELRWTSLSE